MSTVPGSATGTSKEVLQYYARNWESIANCYATGDDGLPVDPAWYRRELYGNFLDRTRPPSVLDIGCGGGWTVLDALNRGIDARGFEPVAELKTFAASLLERAGHDPSRVRQDDLASLAGHESASEDCIALLSVLPHVPAENWEEVHADISRVLRPGGRVIAAYRNELFDLFTFNSFTIETLDTSLWNCPATGPLRTLEMVDGLKGLITHPDVPGPYFTAAKDKSFGSLRRVKSNPLALGSQLEQFGLTVERIRYYHFHCVPPLLADRVPNGARINHRLEAELSDDWRGNFMAAMFLIEAAKV
jgi:SAM-dependent methyltransferase